jgi:hypothetical protein
MGGLFVFLCRGYLFVFQQNFPVTRSDKLLKFVEKSLFQFESALGPQQLFECNNCTFPCANCTQRFRAAMEKVFQSRVEKTALQFITSRASVRIFTRCGLSIAVRSLLDL